MELDVLPHFFEQELSEGDVVLLCSDGISSVLAEDALSRELSLGSGARSLVNHARQCATEETLDDLSAVIVEVRRVEFSHEGSSVRLEIPENADAAVEEQLNRNKAGKRNRRGKVFPGAVRRATCWSRQSHDRENEVSRGCRPA